MYSIYIYIPWDIHPFIYIYIHIHIFIYTYYIITIISTLQFFKYLSNYNLNCHLHTVPIIFRLRIDYIIIVYNMYSHYTHYIPYTMKNKTLLQVIPTIAFQGIYSDIYSVNGHTNPQSQKKTAWYAMAMVLK